MVLKPSLSSTQASSEDIVNRYNVTFLLSTALTSGAGTEQFVLNMARNAPLDKFNISIVQSDLQDMSRLNSEYVRKILGNTRVYTIRSFRRQLRALDNASNYVALALKLFLTCLFGIIYRAVNGSVLDQVRGSDLVYLIRNDDLPYLKIEKRTLVLGSTHCSTLTLGSRVAAFEKYRRLLRVLKYRNVDGFHFTTEKWCKQAVLRKKYDFVLPLGTDTELFHPPEAGETRSRKVRFLFVSRLEADKGVLRLLDAWRLMNTTKAELHIAGGGSLAQLVESTSIENRVIYHGVLSNEDLAALYRSCDVFVFPTQGEIYGLVVLEALASGLFAIVSEDLRGNFDEFERMRMLEYVRNKPMTIAKTMARIASDLGQVESRKQKVYAYIRANNDWKSMSAKLFSTFERILKEQPT